MVEVCWRHFPLVADYDRARRWLQFTANIGRARNTVEAYGRALDDHLGFCASVGADPLTLRADVIAAWISELHERPNSRAVNMLHLDSRVGLSNATIQQRIIAVRLFYEYLVEDGLRLFYDHLIEEGRRETNPVGRGRYTPGHAFRGQRERGLVPRFTKLPWIPSDDQWRQILEVARVEPLRNRLMLALAYDAGLRREELCLLRSDDLDPAHRTLRVRAETTKNRRERVVPYSTTSGVLLRHYLEERRLLSTTRGPLFLSDSRRNRAQPVSLWTWSKVVRKIALRADVPRFSTHALRISV